MTSITGISDFLEKAGTPFKVFDMGRRIQPLTTDDFLAFEQGELAYPFPLQQQAWLGMMIWNEKNNDDLVIWFLRFPLDAKGCLTTGIRDDFVYRLIRKDRQQDEEETNPYGFKPKQEHMASFHAKAAKILGQPASRFYQHAQDYFSGEPGFDQWAFVGFQGIADITVRLDEETNLERIIEALPQLPPQPLEALCQCLEHETITDTLAETLATCLDEELGKETVDANLISLLLRAVSAASNRSIADAQVEKVLMNPVAQHAEVIASISGRCWLSLKQEKLIHLFLENLAQCPEGQDFFNLVIVDLINIPGMQDAIHSAIRQTERSPALSTAIGQLFKHFTQDN